MTNQTLPLQGIYTALATPFSKDGSRVDFESLDRLIQRQLKAKVSGLVACGSSGEAATLSDSEYLEVVAFVREKTRGKVPCVAGISVSGTAKAVEISRHLHELGCDGVLLAAPPYNKPSQAGLIEHVRAVRNAARAPIIAYNIPGRSAVGYSPATLGLLSHEGTICGIKDATGSVDALADTMVLLDPKCQVMTGEDSLLLATLAYGGTGAISACANVMPDDFVAISNAWRAGKVDEARGVQLSIVKKIRACFIESNPVPVKTVLALQGVIAEPTVRLPLAPLAPESLAKLKAEFSL